METRQEMVRFVLHRSSGAVAAAGLAIGASVAAAQQGPPTPTKEDLAEDSKLFLTAASTAIKWGRTHGASENVGPPH
jgi:hypothetical protein